MFISPQFLLDNKPIIDSFFRFLLWFSNASFIIPLIGVGYLFIDKKIFFRAASFLLFTIVFNFALKIFFHGLSASNSLHFPSGHMQASIALYGWLFISLSSFWIRMTIPFIVMGIGQGLVYFNYHTYGDIVGALVFGGLSLVSLWVFLKSRMVQINLGRLLWFLGSIAMLYSVMKVYQGDIQTMKNHIWLSYLFLTGIGLLHKFTKKHI